MKNFAIFSKIFEFLKTFFKNKKKSSFLIILLIGVIVFYFVISTNFNFKNNNRTDEKVEVTTSDYADSIEKKLESMLIKIDEINSVSIMVLVESTPKIEYLTESKIEQSSDEKGSSSTTSTTVVFQKDGSVSTPVVVTTIMPKISGVLIVVNQISASTKLSIINSICVVLNIEESCISILQER